MKHYIPIFKGGIVSGYKMKEIRMFRDAEIGIKIDFG